MIYMGLIHTSSTVGLFILDSLEDAGHQFLRSYQQILFTTFAFLNWLLNYLCHMFFQAWSSHTYYQKGGGAVVCFFNAGDKNTPNLKMSTFDICSLILVCFKLQSVGLKKKPLSIFFNIFGDCCCCCCRFFRGGLVKKSFHACVFYGRCFSLETSRYKQILGFIILTCDRCDFFGV